MARIKPNSSERVMNLLPFEIAWFSEENPSFHFSLFLPNEKASNLKHLYGKLASVSFRFILFHNRNSSI